VRDRGVCESRESDVERPGGAALRRHEPCVRLNRSPEHLDRGGSSGAERRFEGEIGGNGRRTFEVEDKNFLSVKIV
jgi:hypothetical protein